MSERDQVKADALVAMADILEEVAHKTSTRENVPGLIAATSIVRKFASELEKRP